MSPALPPPFGNSTSFMDRNGLEGITFASLIISVPAAVVVIGMAIVMWYCCCKHCPIRTITTKGKCSCTSCTGAAGYLVAAAVMIIVVIPVIIFVVPLLGAVLIAIAVIVVLGSLFGVLVGGFGLCIGGMFRLIPCCIDEILYRRKAFCRPKQQQVVTELELRDPTEDVSEPNAPVKRWDKITSAAHKVWDKISELWDKISAVIITLFFSSVTERLDAGKDTRVELIIAKRKEPKRGIRKHAVRLYFVTVAVLALLWLLLLFVDTLWYQKVTSCNDININNDNHVCYLIDDHGKPENKMPVTCSGRNDPRDVLCYLYTFSPFMAVGIAGSVTRSIVFITDIAFNVALKLAEKEYGCAILVVVQTLAVCISAVFSIVIPVRHVAMGNSLVGWFFQGQTGIRVFVFVLTAISIAVLPMVPWWAFQGKRFIDTTKEDPESQETYLSLDEIGSNTEKRQITWCLEVYTRKDK